MQGTTIRVPDNLVDKGLISFFRGWFWIPQPDGPVTLDFRTCNFLSPWALTLFAAYAMWLRESRGKHVRPLVDKRSVAGDYLCHTGFMELLGEDAASCQEPNSTRTAKLTRITSSIEIPAFAKSVMDILEIGVFDSLNVDHLRVLR